MLLCDTIWLPSTPCHFQMFHFVASMLLVYLSVWCVSVCVRCLLWQVADMNQKWILAKGEKREPRKMETATVATTTMKSHYPCYWERLWHLLALVRIWWCLSMYSCFFFVFSHGEKCVVQIELKHFRNTFLCIYFLVEFKSRVRPVRHSFDDHSEDAHDEIFQIFLIYFCSTLFYIFFVPFRRALQRMDVDQLKTRLFMNVFFKTEYFHVFDTLPLSPSFFQNTFLVW